MNLPDGPYDPHKYETEILNFWLTNQVYKPEYSPSEDRVQSTEEMKKDPRTPWSLICPPPNAYGRPHLGNISGYAYQDAMARYQRMLGKKVLVLPGKDHAGLEGEGVFVRDVLEKKGVDKFTLTREEFYQQIWDFNMQNKEQALKDEQAIGLSADYERDLFTLDPRIVDIVLTTFVEMYKAEMIYKGVRIINWDPKARSTIADNQCIREEREGKLYYIKYAKTTQRVWTLNFYDSSIFDALKNGSKIVETRADNPEEPTRRFKEIKAGDLIICVDKSEHQHPPVYKKVEQTVFYQNLAELFEQGELAKIQREPAATLAELEAFYAKLAPDYEKKANQNGIVALELSELGDDDYLTVATTRPETMFGDTAIAVNPEDKRYKAFVGGSAIIPLTDIVIPVITSPRVLTDFGTGCLKITPAHAQDDYQIMLEWNNTNPDRQIGYRNVIGKDLKLGGTVPQKFRGRKYKEALADIVTDLTASGALVKEETIAQNILISERTKAIVEPIMSSQWFIDVEQVRQPVIDMVKNGKVKIHPQNMESKFFHWMDNLRDWAISRSLWWGYRMPVWYAGPIEERIDEQGQVQPFIQIADRSEILDPTNPKHMQVQLEQPADGWIQEDSVLDTWFSSGQWPYATLTVHGLMDTFYPTDVMETGHDILENWVSRMMMFSYFKLKEIPFKDVYLHGLVLGKDGQKMSKSRKNVIPMDEARDQYGTDALRMVYFYQNSAGASYALTYDKLKNFKNFCNKIWNASKFVLMNIPDDFSQQMLSTDQLKLETSKKIFDHIIALKAKITKNIDAYEFGYATETLYDEFWHTFCDVLIEESKPHLAGDQDHAEIQQVLIFALKEYLKLLHPFIPFITEKIWQTVPHTQKDHKVLMYTRW